MRVRFTADFDYRPTPQVTVGYLAGMEMTVKRECAEQAIAAGKAARVSANRREATDGEQVSG
ncbi:MULTISPECIES: hypothetical protein [unclassified Ensifer]|uniref:hypothetical protein n=1 Tax=unclassified Ensifer TaxID=2633371 RepID=UPI0007151EEE|nr:MULTISPECIES: hypothetical protein [unclassified Ensifer]KQX55466.1 hypothetical protein ASD49_25260 [Ensifer sp. Root1298]KQX90958.1 hypothetical protein ASD41_23950 [Ensifer sp. Root1312]KRC25803.1 hypothetical protein ASE29_22410 [Ensifer sp. Root74]KRD73682.1 hypothetical protein ASE71_19735 [Ensifer sp. Root954]